MVSEHRLVLNSTIFFVEAVRLVEFQVCDPVNVIAAVADHCFHKFMSIYVLK